MRVGPFAFKCQGNGATPCQYIDTTRKAMRYNFAAESFSIMKLCSRFLVLYCRNWPKDDKFRYFIPILRKLGRRRILVDGSLESPLLNAIELLFLSLAVEALQGKMCQNSLPSGEGRSLGAKISGGRGRPPANILIPPQRQIDCATICRWHFYIMKLFSTHFVLYCRKCPKDDKFRYFIPHFEEVRGGVGPWLMAGWKAPVSSSC